MYDYYANLPYLTKYATAAPAPAVAAAAAATSTTQCTRGQHAANM